MIKAKPYTGIFFGMIAVLAGFLLCGTWDALAQSTPFKGNPDSVAGVVAPAALFAFPGGTCPPGSALYRGPEAKLAEGSGVVYCQIRPAAIVMTKTEQRKSCPPGLRRYQAEGLEADPDILWCERDPEFKVPPPPPLDQEFGPDGRPLPKD